MTYLIPSLLYDPLCVSDHDSKLFNPVRIFEVGIEIRFINTKRGEMSTVIKWSQKNIFEHFDFDDNFFFIVIFDYIEMKFSK